MSALKKYKWLIVAGAAAFWLFSKKGNAAENTSTTQPLTQAEKDAIIRVNAGKGSEADKIITARIASRGRG